MPNGEKPTRSLAQRIRPRSITEMSPRDADHRPVRTRRTAVQAPGRGPRPQTRAKPQDEQQPALGPAIPGRSAPVVHHADDPTAVLCRLDLYCERGARRAPLAGYPVDVLQAFAAATAASSSRQRLVSADASRSREP